MKAIRSLLLIGALVLCAATLGEQRMAQAQGSPFTPPPGWRVIKAPGHGLGIWQHPDSDSFHQNISVLAEAYSGSLDAFAQNGVHQLRSLLPDIEVGHIQRATVCGSHPATYLNYAATVNGRLLLYEQMATIYGGVAYVATYTRASGQPSLAEARTALTSLCGRGITSGSPGWSNGGYQPSASSGGYRTPSPSPTDTPNGGYATAAPVGSVAPTITPRP